MMKKYIPLQVLAMQVHLSIAQVTGRVDGSGITVSAMTNPAAYTDRHVMSAMQVANSIQFKEPEKSSIVDQWKQKFINGHRWHFWQFRIIRGRSGFLGGQAGDRRKWCRMTGLIAFNF